VRRILSQSRSVCESRFFHNWWGVWYIRTLMRKSKFLTGKLFSQWLRAYRQQNQLTLRELSHLTGIAMSRLSEIEHGKMTNPSLKYFTGFAKALGCKNLTELFAEIEGAGWSAKP
jgi:DNA-binding Xre family transcriptional regulator